LFLWNFFVHGQHMAMDGRSVKWVDVIRDELAPELKPTYDRLVVDAPPTEEKIEQLKNALDQGASLDQFSADLTHNGLLMTLLQGIIGVSEPNFKMPPGPTFPMAPASGHQTISSGENIGIPNTEKSHISGVQRDAVNSGLGTLRTFSSGLQVLNTDSQGTRQSSEHKKFPSYGQFLNSMMNHYAVTNGFGIGTAPLTLMKATAGINPMFPLSPGALGSGADIFGYKNAKMMTPIGAGSNPMMPFAFPPSRFETNMLYPGFNLPNAAVAQTKNDVLNAIPKAFSYATSYSATPISGIQPMFM